MKIVKVVSEIKSKIIDFWLKEGVFTNDIAKTRVEECLFVAMDNDEIIGVCSGVPLYVKELRDWFYYYRAYIKQDNRHNGIAKELTCSTCDYLNNNRVLNGKDLKGVYVIFQNPLLNTNVKEYVTKKSKLIFLGFNEIGQQIRVFYFENTKFKD